MEQTRARLSRAESVRLYFLTLPASDRADVLTVRDLRAVEIIRGMQDMQVEGGAARTPLFSLAGVAQRRTLKSYGQWVPASRQHTKATQASNAPTLASLTKTDCQPELIVSQRIVDAACRIEKGLRLDFNSTLSVPVSRLRRPLWLRTCQRPFHLPMTVSWLLFVATLCEPAISMQLNDSYRCKRRCLLKKVMDAILRYKPVRASEFFFVLNEVSPCAVAQSGGRQAGCSSCGGSSDTGAAGVRQGGQQSPAVMLCFLFCGELCSFSASQGSNR